LKPERLGIDFSDKHRSVTVFEQNVEPQVVFFIVALMA
jgi:hypothetical protein